MQLADEEGDQEFSDFITDKFLSHLVRTPCSEPNLSTSVQRSFFAEMSRVKVVKVKLVLLRVYEGSLRITCLLHSVLSLRFLFASNSNLEF